MCLCWACNNIEDAKPENRSTFIRFYEAAHNVYGITAEETEGGYVILGNARQRQSEYFVYTN
jgi:hypothetical protein